MDDFFVYLLGIRQRLMAFSLIVSTIFIFVGIVGYTNNWSARSRKMPFRKDWFYKLLIASGCVLFLFFVFSPDVETLCRFIEGQKPFDCLMMRHHW